ncbi:MAG: CDP-alcohol phosphatidyltransferase family protein [Rhodospirillaceae bacterium]|nr:CDP-alcohol phosphatidyltransferase family protein [Rhodospirillaceae bacterium]
MLDARLRPLVDRSLDGAGAWLAGRGVTANAVSLAAFACGLAAMAALAVRWDLVALALLACNRVGDGLDGAVARTAGPTDRGGFLDIVLDFIVYAAVVFGFVLGRPEHALAGAFLLFGFMGTGASFLAYAAIAAKRGLSTSLRGRKSLYYLGGLTEGTETIAVLVAICLLPDAFPWLAWGFGAACWVTTATRILAGWQSFAEP